METLKLNTFLKINIIIEGHGSFPRVWKIIIINCLNYKCITTFISSVLRQNYSYEFWSAEGYDLSLFKKVCLQSKAIFFQI